MCHWCWAQIFRRIAIRGHDLNRKLSCVTCVSCHVGHPLIKRKWFYFPKFVNCLVPLVSGNIRTRGKTKNDSIETILPKLWAENGSIPVGRAVVTRSCRSVTTPITCCVSHAWETVIITWQTSGPGLAISERSFWEVIVVVIFQNDSFCLSSFAQCLCIFNNQESSDTIRSSSSRLSGLFCRLEAWGASSWRLRERFGLAETSRRNA